MKQFIRILTSNKFLLVGYLILTSFIILMPALFNGYPLFYSDSALYIKAAMLFGNVHADESIPSVSGLGYAFFIRIVTWQSTLYLVILAQAIILNILIYHSLKVLLPEKRIITYHLPIIFILSIGSSLGWTAGQLMPDIFTSCLILAVFLFFAWNKKNWGVYIFLSVLIILSILSHLSNISILVLILALLSVLFLLKSSYRTNLKLFIRKSLVLIALLFASCLILTGLNKKYYDYAGLSPTSHIFFMARLMDTDIMKEFLNEKCGEKTYEMCQYKDNLPNCRDFLWSQDSFFYKTGGWNITKHEEYKIIIRDVMTSPKYIGKFLYNCAIHSYYQLLTFKTGDGLTPQYNNESDVYMTAISHFDKKELRINFQESKQIQGTLNFELINLINSILLLISFLIIVWTILFNKLDSNMLLFTYIIICGLVVNATVAASLTSIYDRFQSRVIWLIPLLASIYFFRFIYPALTSFFKKKLENKA